MQVLVRPAAVFGGGEDFVLRDGSVLRSGDGVQLRIGSDVDAYVYVIAYGSSNRAILLHPFSAKPQDALIAGGQSRVIPGDGAFLPLDGREGRETLFSIVSDVPLMDVGELLPRIEAHGDDLSAITAMIGEAYPRAQRLTFKHIAASPLVGITASAPRAEATASQGSGTQARVDVSPSVGGGNLLPPAGGGWSVPSTQDFGSAERPAAAGAEAAIGTPAAAPAQAAPAANASEPVNTASAAAHVSPPASASGSSREAAGEAASASAAAASAPPRKETAALRKARQAAGIDEQQFRGILATLPGSGESGVPEGVREPYKEQGVLSGQGSRIRAFGGDTSVSSGAGWPSGDTPSKTQN